MKYTKRIHFFKKKQYVCTYHNMYIALQAMRHIVFADFQRLFHFHLGAENLAGVQLCAERFVQYHLGVFPEALTFYHKITAPVLHSEEEPHEQEL